MAAVDATAVDLDAALLDALVTNAAWPAHPATTKLPSPWIEPTPAGTGGLVPCPLAAIDAMNNAAAFGALPLFPPSPADAAALLASPPDDDACLFSDLMAGGDAAAGPDAKRARSGEPVTPVFASRAAAAAPTPPTERRRAPTRLLPFSLVPRRPSGPGYDAAAVASSPAAAPLADLNARLRAAAAASAKAAAAAAGGGPPPPSPASPATPAVARGTAPGTPATPLGGAGRPAPTLLCGPGASPAACIRVSRVASCALGPPAP